ncbi:MAG: hypothetical protein ABW048_13420 [Sphingobium sp.]
MTGSAPELADAKARAAIARSEFHAASSALSNWFNPGRLKAEASIAATQQIDEAKAALRRSVTRHPLASWSVAAALAALFAWLLRRPARSLARTATRSARTLRRQFDKRKH